MTKVGVKNTDGLGLFAVDWRGAFRNVQISLVEEIINKARGPHFAKVVRILRQKGYLEEKEVRRMALLPQKNILSILNRLVADKVVQL